MSALKAEPEPEPEHSSRLYKDISNSDSNSNNDEQSDKKDKRRSTKGRVFQCTGFPGCNMSFTRSEHLARHKRKHTGERPFTCPYCLKNFSRLDNLRQHKQTVHAYENYLATKKDKNIDSEEDQGHINFYPGPGTPNHLSLASPPNSHSPHHNYPYFQYGKFYDTYQQPYPFQQHPPQHQPQHQPQPQPQPQQSQQSQQSQSQQLQSQPQPQSQPQQPQHSDKEEPNQSLKLPAHQFKPKRRPRPLSLQHSFVLNSDKLSSTLSSFSSSGSTTVSTPIYMNKDQIPGLKSAPPIPLYSFSNQLNQHPPQLYKSMLPYPNGMGGPKLALLGPNLVSPLSPLHHHNPKPPQSPQPNVNQLHPLRTQYSPAYQNYQFPNGLTVPPNQLGSSLVLPPVHQIVSNRPQHNRNAHSLNSIAHETDISTANTTPIRSQHPPIKDINKDKDSTKSWLRGVLNEEASNDTKKPSINNMVSPSDENFPPDIK